jgi:adenosyl cobinamide kinase/adenosyl cobinamide phosphate guanylyltransferase
MSARKQPRTTMAKPAGPDPKAREVRLPGFLVSEEVGMGDVIKKATAWAGVKPCGGCNKRAAALNQRVTFTPRGRQ